MFQNAGEDSGAPRTRLDPRDNLRPVLLGQSVSLFGDYMAFFALPWLVVVLTGRERDLGLTAAAETIPMLLFGLAAGVVLDRTVLRRSLIFADVARGVAFALLALAAATDVASVWMVFGVAFIVGSMSVFFDSGLQAMLPTVLREHMLVEVNSRLQLARNLAMVTGPAAAGLMITGFGGFEAVFIVNALTFLVSAAFLLSVRELTPPDRAETGAFGAALLAGLRFLWTETRLRWGTLGATGANLVVAPIEATLVIFAKEQLSLGAAGTGFFIAGHALVGAGGVAVAAAVARRLNLGRTVVVGMGMLGGGFLALSATRSLLPAAVFAGIALAGVGWVNVALSTMRQRLTPQPLLGRVIAASRTIGWAGLPVGAAAGGFIADATGVVPLYRVSALAVVAIALGLAAGPLWSRPVEAVPASGD